MGVVMDISDRVVVLDYGTQDRRRLAGGGARPSQEVIDAYLGVRTSDQRRIQNVLSLIVRSDALVDIAFFFEVLIGGLLSGVMYSLVALGFVLIYKASGVFNFAQGTMVFFAALTFVGADRARLAVWLALARDPGRDGRARAR